MGQFIFKVNLSVVLFIIRLCFNFFFPQKVKLVDVEKVEWINRRSYSAISIYLGSRDGRVLLRCDNCLEDWFELLEVQLSVFSKKEKIISKIFFLMLRNARQAAKNDAEHYVPSKDHDQEHH